MFVGAANPCPCGNLYEKNGKCTCSRGQINNYITKLSGPLMDRIDLSVIVRSVPAEKIGVRGQETSTEIRKRVIKARDIQAERYAKEEVKCNGDVVNISYYRAFDLDRKSRELLNNSVNSLGLSVRAYNKAVKVARTIADLDGSETIKEEHILESLQYRLGEKSVGGIAA